MVTGDEFSSTVDFSLTRQVTVFLTNHLTSATAGLESKTASNDNLQDILGLLNTLSGSVKKT